MAESTDEIGQLATEFNHMTARLRSYEETTLGKLMAERRKSETKRGR
ncbi:MAG: HAMP domain-containing protein [Bacillota bacterium]